MIMAVDIIKARCGPKDVLMLALGTEGRKRKWKGNEGERRLNQRYRFR